MRLLAVLAALLLAGPAEATSLYAQLITPETTYEASGDFYPWAFGSWSVTPRGQMGGGQVSAQSTAQSWVHILPEHPGLQIDHAWIHVTLSDRHGDLDREVARIDVGGQAWGTRSFRFLDASYGSVLGALTGNQLRLDVHSLDGSFQVESSLLRVRYSAAPPMPEPGALMAFGAGALVVGLALRTRALRG